MGSDKEAEIKDSLENVSYVFGFAEKHGITYGYHMSDFLQDPVTWKSVEFKFSTPNSQYLLVWRRDNKKITDEESQILVDYVKEDMEDFTSEGEQSGPRTCTKILHMLLPSRECLVMAYDELVLPEEYESWEDFTGSAFYDVWDLSENAVEQGGYDEKIEKILDGSALLDLEKDR